MTKRVSAAVWKERIETCKRSGEKVEKWCEDNEVSRPAYYYWHRRIKKLEITDQRTNPIFVEVPKTSNKVLSRPEISIEWRDFSIKIRDEETVPMLAKLLNRLGDESC